jgi:hypothetical protein
VNKIPLSYLDNRLSNILDGLPFNEWSEKIVDSICPNSLPIKLEEYFPTTRVKNISVNTALSYPAKIKKSDSCFTIELKNNADWNHSKYYRFIIAHEIAHTFQYSNKNGSLQEQTYFLPGSYEEEYFSNRIARNLLMPRKLFLPLVDEFFDTLSEKFTLKVINFLSEKFQVDYQKVLLRLFNDLEIYKKATLLRFIESQSGQWKLFGRYQSNEFATDKKYYIPLGFKKNGSLSYPTCHDKINRTLNSFSSSMEFGIETPKKLRAEDFIDRPLKHFIKNFEGKTFNNAIVSKAREKNSIVINVLISLDEKDIE